MSPTFDVLTLFEITFDMIVLVVATTKQTMISLISH